MNKRALQVIVSAIALTLYACGSNSTSPDNETPSSSSITESSSSEESDSSSSSEDSSSSEEPQSSSSSEDSSSSEEPQSSSSSEKLLETGTLIDTRDNQTYKTVKIGTTNWMAQNLNYNFNDNYGNTCPDKDEEKCAKFGRLYAMGTAMDSSAVFSSHGRSCGSAHCEAKGAVRGICPEGWRLPNKNDFKKLIEFAGGSDQAGMNLKATTSWILDSKASPATDALGFSMLASGFGDPYSYDSEAHQIYTLYFDQGTKGAILSSDYEDNFEVSILLLENDSDKASIVSNSREILTPVRCVESTADDVFYDIPDPFADEVDE